MDKPYIDISGLAFADDEEQRTVLEKYTDDLTEYIKEQLQNKKNPQKTVFLHFSLAIYIFLIVIQLCFFVPSTHYKIYISSQSVPHKITYLNKYVNILDADTSIPIGKEKKSFIDYVYEYKNKTPNTSKNQLLSEGWELNTNRFTIQIILVSFIYFIICTVLYFLLRIKFLS